MRVQPAAETADEVRNRWSELLRMERHRRRLTQLEVAQLAEVSQKVVFSAENGRGSLDSFLAVARALGIDLFAEAAS